MAETLALFDTPVIDRYGRLYSAKACGRMRDDRLWEGWIEFQNEATRATVRSYRETTQPNLTDLKYWATGLTPVFLEGALDRTLPKPPVRTPAPEPLPAFDGPAERPGRERPHARESILNPFSVFDKSPELLAQELRALRGWHLRQIIRDYDLVRDNDVLERLTEPELGSLIVDRVRELRA